MNIKSILGCFALALIMFSCNFVENDTENYRASYIDDSGKEVVTTAKIGELPKAAKEHYVLQGWYVDEAKTKKFDPKQHKSGAVKLYPKWDKIMFTATFDTLGGKAIAPMKIHSGKEIGKQLPKAVRNKDNFTAWYTEKSYVNEFTRDSVVLKNITLYAKYSARRARSATVFTITYHHGSGRGITQKTTSTGIVPYVTSTNDENKFKFAGWYSDSAFSESSKVDFQKFRISSDIDLYAYWKHYPSTKIDLINLINGEISNQGYSANLTHIDTGKITDMSNLFDAKSVGSNFHGNISNWDTSKVTNMSKMFSGGIFSGDISAWDTKNVTDMSGMFENTMDFFSNVDLSNWIVSSVTNMSRMFKDARAFDADISNWDVSNVTNMSRMFNDAHVFDADLSKWNTSNVTDMSHMFAWALNFNQDISNWNTSNVTDMSYMFAWGYNFNQDISNWNTTNVTNMSHMFEWALKFNRDLNTATLQDGSKIWDTSNVTDMSFMFRGARAFKGEVKLWNVSNVTDMSHMFESSIFNGDLSLWNTGNVTTMENMFADSEFNGNIIYWRTSKVTNMRRMFRNNHAFNQDISLKIIIVFFGPSDNRWVTDQVLYMGEMFFYATSFDQDLNSWGVPDNIEKGSVFENSPLRRRGSHWPRHWQYWRRD